MSFNYSVIGFIYPITNFEMVKALFFIVLFFLFFSHTYCRYLRFNVALVIVNTTNPNVLFLNAFTRGRYGLMYLGVSNSNSTHKEGFVLMGYVRGQQIINRYIGGDNTTDLLPRLYQEKDNLLINCTDQNEYPIGRYVNGIFFNCYLNKTLFIQKYGQRFWVTVGFSYLYVNSPNSPTDFQWPLPASTPPTWEKQVFSYQIEEVGEGLDLREAFPRWETFHLSIYIISLCFYVFMGIITLCFMGQQPLKSRGMTPILACM